MASLVSRVRYRRRLAWLGVALYALGAPWLVSVRWRLRGPMAAVTLTANDVTSMASVARTEARALQSWPERVLFPALAVTHVSRDPGHCPPTVPGGAGALAEYRATVRPIAWFGVYGSTIELSCGGASWSRPLPPVSCRALRCEEPYHSRSDAKGSARSAEIRVLSFIQPKRTATSPAAPAPRRRSPRARAPHRGRTAPPRAR
jgi:hypothetical protein